MPPAEGVPPLSSLRPPDEDPGRLGDIEGTARLIAGERAGVTSAIDAAAGDGARARGLGLRALVVLLAVPFAAPLAYLVVRNAEEGGVWSTLADDALLAPLGRSLLLATIGGAGGGGRRHRRRPGSSPAPTCPGGGSSGCCCRCRWCCPRSSARSR